MSSDCVGDGGPTRSISAENTIIGDLRNMDGNLDRPFQNTSCSKAENVECDIGTENSEMFGATSHVTASSCG